MKFKQEVKKNNSVYELLEAAGKFAFSTENELFMLAWGYDRNLSSDSNKKYADMLRRALAKKWISRVDNREVVCRNDIGKARYVYMLNNKGMAALWGKQAKQLAKEKL